MNGDFMADYEMIVNRFLEDTKFDTNPTILLLIVYGSRVTNTNTPNSDLDLFAITSQSKSYKIKRIIEGCLVECNVFSIESLDFLVEEKYYNNDFYFESVLKNGIVLKSLNGTIEWFRNSLEEIHSINPRKRMKVNRKLLSKLTDMFYIFYDAIKTENQEMIDYSYFNLIEYIRQVYQKKYGFSPVSLFKVFNIYADKEKYTKEYLIKLPSDDFILKYKEAVDLKLTKDRIKILEYLLGLIQVDCKQYHVVEEEQVFLSINQIKFSLLTMNDKKCKLIESLMYNYSWADSLYFVFLRQINELYNYLYNDNEYFEKLFTDALKEKNINTRIFLIEELFLLVDRDYRFDYDDCDVIRQN